MWSRLLPERADHRLTPDIATAEIRAKVIEELAPRMSDPSRDVLVEKNPKHSLRVAFLDALFPDCRILHLIRDGRDTVASLMFRNRGANWGHLKIPGWKALLERYPTQNHIRCAHQWHEAVRLARNEGTPLGPQRYHEVRFEDLAASPVAAVERILGFLGLETTAAVRDAAAKIQDSTQDSYHAQRQVRHFVDNHAVRVGRWRENLSAQQVAEIAAVCGELLRELGYEG